MSSAVNRKPVFCKLLARPPETDAMERRTNDSSAVLGKIRPISLQEQWNVIFHQINASLDLLFLTRLKTSQSKIRMQAACDPLKQLLIRFKRDCKEHRFIATEATYQTVAGNERTEGTRIHIIPRYISWAPYLTWCVSCFHGPRLNLGHPQ